VLGLDCEENQCELFHRAKRVRLNDETMDELNTGNSSINCNSKTSVDLTEDTPHNTNPEEIKPKIHKTKNNNTQEKTSIEPISKSQQHKRYVRLELPVHKCILCAFSPVLKKCFEHKMKENLEGSIEIEGVDPYVMRSLIQYLYTETIEPSDMDKTQLLLLADRYQIRRLVVVCLNDLKNDINIHNCVDLLVISHKLSHVKFADGIKKECVEFIAKNLTDVMKTEAYQNTLINNKDLVHEIFQHISAGVSNCVVSTPPSNDNKNTVLKKKAKKRLFGQMEHF